MSLAAAEEPKHEIVIVRRGHDDHDDAHHGGVWKIAFADFMTAMMCFFLVMWLINASNEQTKAAVASYFNPIKLIDRNSSRKGLEDLGDGPHAVGMDAETPVDPTHKAGVDGRGNAGPATEKNSVDSAETEKRSDEHLFSEPYAVLAEIAGDTGVRQNVSVKGDGGVQIAGPSTGASGGEAYRDPFAPDFWSQEVAANETAESSPPEQSGEADAQVNAEPLAAMAAPAPDPASREQAAEAGELPETQTPLIPKAQPAFAAEDRPLERENTSPSPDAEAVADEIRAELEKAFTPGEKLAEGLSVVAGEDGVTISVTDQLDFGMFEIGSALPRREMVLAMEKIAKTLAERKGTITVGGHTDGRPFKSATYDNWRLSTARAHSAYYMLVRAGLDERRVTEVAGHADRQLKETADPFAAGNRRIEILLEVDG